MDPILIAAISLVVGVVAALAYQNYLKKKRPSEKEVPKEAKEPDACGASAFAGRNCGRYSLGLSGTLPGA